MKINSIEIIITNTNNIEKGIKKFKNKNIEFSFFYFDNIYSKKV